MAGCSVAPQPLSGGRKSVARLSRRPATGYRRRMRVLLVEFPGPRRDQLRDVLWREGADVLVASPDMPEANRQGPPPDVLHSVVSGLELPMGSTLPEALRDRGATLLWFDEIEAVAELLAEEVSALLDACPKLVVLVTHLQPLGLRGERVYRLAPLPPAGGDEVDTVLASTAARLFEERATEHDPGFSLTADNAQSVAAITRALDGLPLGLELAASLVGSLPLEGLLRGFESSLDLLRASETDRPRRHRGLRAALDPSWDRLSPAERARLPQLTVFVGSFTLPSRTVAQGKGRPRACSSSQR